MTEPQRIDRIAKLAQMAPARLAEVAAIDERDEHTEQLKRRHSVLTELWNKLSPARFRHASIADLDLELRRDMEAWIADRGVNVVLIGPVGTGKTHALWATIREIHFQSVRWSGGSVPELVDSLRPDRERTFDPAADVLMLDDIGAERQTDWTAEQLTRIIDQAWSDARPILASTNLKPEDLQRWLGDRAWSRLLGGALVLGVAGEDRRFRNNR